MHSSGSGCSICNWRYCSGGLQGCQGCLDPAPCNARYAMVENMSDILLCNNCNKNPSDMLHYWHLTKHNNQTQHIQHLTNARYAAMSRRIHWISCISVIVCSRDVTTKVSQGSSTKSFLKNNELCKNCICSMKLKV